MGLDIMTYITYRFGNSKVKPYLENVRSSLEFASSTVIAINVSPFNITGFECHIGRSIPDTGIASSGYMGS